VLSTFLHNCLQSIFVCVCVCVCAWIVVTSGATKRALHSGLSELGHVISTALAPCRMPDRCRQSRYGVVRYSHIIRTCVTSKP